LSGGILALSSILAYNKLKEKPKEIHKIPDKDKSAINEEIAAGIID
jgi:hypothetical protein